MDFHGCKATSVDGKAVAFAKATAASSDEKRKLDPIVGGVDLFDFAGFRYDASKHRREVSRPRLKIASAS